MGAASDDCGEVSKLLPCIVKEHHGLIVPICPECPGDVILTRVWCGWHCKKCCETYQVIGDKNSFPACLLAGLPAKTKET